MLNTLRTPILWGLVLVGMLFVSACQSNANTHDIANDQLNTRSYLVLFSDKVPYEQLPREIEEIAIRTGFEFINYHLSQLTGWIVAKIYVEGATDAEVIDTLERQDSILKVEVNHQVTIY